MIRGKPSRYRSMSQTSSAIDRTSFNSSLLALIKNGHTTMALNAKRSPAVPVETVPLSTNAEHEELGPSTRSVHPKSESAEGFEILDDTEVAEVRGLGLQVSLT